MVCSSGYQVGVYKEEITFWLFILHSFENTYNLTAPVHLLFFIKLKSGNWWNWKKDIKLKRRIVDEKSTGSCLRFCCIPFSHLSTPHSYKFLILYSTLCVSVSVSGNWLFGWCGFVIEVFFFKFTLYIIKMEETVERRLIVTF